MHLSKKIKSDQTWKERGQKPESPNSHRLDLRSGRKRAKRKNWLTAIIFSRQMLYALVVLLSLATIGGAIAYNIIARSLPDPNKLIDRQIVQSTKIYDRTGENVLYEISGDIKRTLVNLNEIPDNVKNATVVIEDKDFYNHGGISYWAIFRTAVTNLLFGQKAGGSTLTQQFIKNAVLTNDKKYIRKIKEAILAVRMEKKFSKDQILQMYLNEIPYGSTAYGVEAASQLYFGKHVKDINLPEAAILAALPQAPSTYSPYGTHQDMLFARQRYILDLMVKNGYVSKDEAAVAKGVKISFRQPSEKIAAPHFVMYVKSLLEDKYGARIEQEGFKIYTTLDLYKQKIAEETVTKYGLANEKYQASNAALLSIDPKTGQILAMVGSRDYYNEKIDGQVNITTSPRQPGSSIKPIVYAAAFIRGYTPNTTLYDVVTNFSADPSRTYEPHDYNGKENGPVSMKKALAGSLNIPAVKTLYLAGIDRVLGLTKDLGYTTLNDKDRYGLSLVLGGGEVKMLEHVNAFSAFAREGKMFPVSAILKIVNKDGKVVEEFKPADEKKVFDANIARQINDILSDNNARAYIFGARNLMTLGERPVAVKTGTTNDYRDAWTIGYTPSLITGVWVGNNDYTPMAKGSAAATIAVPIWHDYMKTVLGDTPIESFKKPTPVFIGKNVLDGKNVGETKVKIDKTTGLLATENTPPDQIEEKTYKDNHCILYYINRDDPRGPAPENSYDDPQFVLWETRVQRWAEKQGFASSTPPKEYDNVHLPENKPKLKIVSPANNDAISQPFLSSRIETTAVRGVARAEYYIDGNLLAVNTSYPFDLEKQIDFLGKGFHDLKVKVCDDVGNCAEEAIEFNLTYDNGQRDSTFGLILVEPLNNASFLLSDFPRTIKLSLNNPKNIAKLEVIAVGPDKKENLLTSLVVPESIEALISWSKPVVAGAYQLYAKAVGWNGQTITTEKNSIVVTEKK